MRAKKRRALKALTEEQKEQMREEARVAAMSPADRHRHSLKKYSGIRTQIARANGERFENGRVSSVGTYRSPYELRATRGKTADAKQR